MVGERMHAGSLREISGVCTHPNFQGRGFARRLMLKLVRRQMQRNETTFLHVMRDNTGARQLYERMGFRNYRETIVRVIARRCPDGRHRACGGHSRRQVRQGVRSAAPDLDLPEARLRDVGCA